MKKWSILIVFSILLSFTGYTQAYYDQPKLVITLVVDQMRQDYLYRYWDLYGEDGFKKLVNDGYNFTNSHFTYYPTYTAAGHANIGTGTTPSVNGIVANAWYENETGEYMYCTGDNNVESVGTTTKAGKMSPKNLKSTTFSDELRLATNFRSRAYGVSMKDRGAILPVGHFANAAYWLQAKEGNFISSTYYMDDLPEWVLEFNAENRVEDYLTKTWEPMVSMDILRKYSEEDDSPYENVVDGKDSPTFPYNLKELIKHEKNGLNLILQTPYGNSIAFDFTKALIENEQIGQTGSGVPDFLSLSLSSPDYVGHGFALRAMETADTYLRLDKELGEFIRYLEKTIGKDEFTLVLTADHGGADNPPYLNDHGYQVEFFQGKIISGQLRDHLKGIYGKDPIQHYTNLNIYLNRDTITDLNIDRKEVIAEIQDFLRFKPGIQRTVLADNLMKGGISDEHMQMFMRGYDPNRCGDVIVFLKPGWVNMSWSDKGTSHGSVFSYDTHVPMVFYGKNIPAGFSYDITSPSNIAATFSALMGISRPSGCVVEPLVRYFDK